MGLEKDRQVAAYFFLYVFSTHAFSYYFGIFPLHFIYGGILMKRVIFFSVITLVLMGCGGGSGSQEAVSQKVSQDANANLSLDQQVENTKNTDTKSTSDTNSASANIASVTANPYPTPFIGEEEKSEFLRIINAARAEGQDCGKIDSNGIPVKDSKGHYIYDGSNIMAPADPLTWSAALYTAAYEHSDDLAKSDTASHSGSGTESDWTGEEMGGVKSTFVDRARNSGYRFVNLGENISLGTHRDSIKKAVDSWLKSPGHCVNLMKPFYTEVGVGHVEKKGTTYTQYWTQVLGTPVR